MLRRKRPDPATEALRGAFARVAAEVDRAQRALLAAIPTARDPGVPLGQALAGFARALQAAGEAMPGWHDGRLEEDHRACAAAIATATAEAERLRLEPGPLAFEALNARVGDVLHPLEVFADTERALRRL